jgi:uncharacterized protein YdiU (UPF0061 family)
MTYHFPFENTFARLPDRFFARVAPTPVAAPRLIRLNLDLAADLGLDPERLDWGGMSASGNRAGSLPWPENVSAFRATWS